MVLGVGVEPTKAGAGRFTVWCVWPLRYPSDYEYISIFLGLVQEKALAFWG